LKNIPAFEQLSSSIDRRGKPYTREDITRNPILRGETVATGLERVSQVGVLARKYITGELSVRALRTLPDIEDPFQIRHPQRTAAATWFIRTRLLFYAPPGAVDGLETGDKPHVVITAYALTADAPRQIDEHFDGQNSSKSGRTPGVLENNYLHGTPSKPNIVISDNEKDGRRLLLQRWIRDSPEHDGMSMLCSTSEGQVNATELPSTIDWLLHRART
jgi:hypothetical protein